MNRARPAELILVTRQVRNLLRGLGGEFARFRFMIIAAGHQPADAGDQTPLPMMERTARAARILDGPDELHITTVARRLLTVAR